MRSEATVQYIGRSLDGLTLAERVALTNQWIALELYSPEMLPLRVIAAVGGDVHQCVQRLTERGLDPTRYYYEAIPPVLEP